MSRWAQLRDLAELDSISTIHITAVAHSDDIDNLLSIIDVVHHSVIADSNAPKALGTLQLAGTGRAWILGKSFDATHDARGKWWFEGFQLLSCRAGKRDCIVSHRDADCVGDSGGA